MSKVELINGLSMKPRIKTFDDLNKVRGHFLMFLDSVNSKDLHVPNLNIIVLLVHQNTV